MPLLSSKIDPEIHSSPRKHLKMIKLLILKNSPNTYLLGKLTEMDEEPSLLLEDVFTVGEGGVLDEYPLHTTQRFIFLTSTDIMTILDPAPAVLSAYRSKVPLDE